MTKETFLEDNILTKLLIPHYPLDSFSEAYLYPSPDLSMARVIRPKENSIRLILRLFPGSSADAKN